MINSFRNSLNDANHLRSVNEHCVTGLGLPGDYSDLLRMSLIYCMSALDKLVHDVIIHEMVEIYSGRRSPTPKYLSEGISLDKHAALAQATIPPAEIVFEGIARAKLGHLSFMDPSKLADGLSIVWPESHKWQVIAAGMERNPDQVKTELRNLYKRRNAIVHEADRDPSTDQKLPIQPNDAERAQLFIGELGETIYRLV